QRDPLARGADVLEGDGELLGGGGHRGRIIQLAPSCIILNRRSSGRGACHEQEVQEAEPERGDPQTPQRAPAPAVAGWGDEDGSVLHGGNESLLRLPPLRVAASRRRYS